MNALELAPGWGLVVLILALLGVALFLAAIWSGRWGVWVAGYLCIILAVAAAVLGQYRGGTNTADPAQPAVAQAHANQRLQPRQDRLAIAPPEAP